MSDAFVHSSTPQNQIPDRFAFQKDNKSLFVLYLKTLLLSVVTLGVYFFWARVAITKYLYNHSSFGGQSFDYHATGKEMFFGFIKGLGIVAGFALVSGILFFVISKIFTGVILIFGISLSICALYIGVGLVGLPFLILGKWRFMLSRSSWCSVRFSSTGDHKSFRKLWIKGILLSCITLGLYGFVFQNELQKYLAAKSNFGKLKFAYNGDNKEFFWLNLKGILLTIITVGIYGCWYVANVYRYILSHTSLDGHKFDSQMNGGGLFYLSFTNMLIVIFTLGLGFPIAVNQTFSYIFEHITLDATVENLKTTAGEIDTRASALANGLEEASNVVGALSGII